MSAGIVAASYGYQSIQPFEVTRRSVPLARLPQAFRGFTICHLTDLHLSEFGHNQETLVAVIAEAKPDLIAMTGDMVNCDDCEEGPFLTLCDRLPAIAPTCFVSGNHEVSRAHRGLGERVVERGVYFMDNRHAVIGRKGEKIYLAGAGEWLMHGPHGVERAMMGVPPEGCSVLMAHHPAPIAFYAEAGADFVLAGHTHGGQIRAPFLGALLAPGQGFFPKYSDGMYGVKRTIMYISRGLGQSHLPVRINCPREVAFLTLEPSGRA